MRGNVISYIEMCQKEGTSLQRGMNFRLKGHHSVILMSVRPNSPYRDARGKRFLNLFAYTGSATVHAAMGGARSTTTVDMSKTYLGWAQDNMTLNGFRGSEHEYLQADCTTWLHDEAARGRRQYDLIFMDPPTFSNSKRMEAVFDVQRDHVQLIRQAAQLLAPGGVLYFSNNYRKFKLDEAALAGLAIEDITQKTIPEDFKRNTKIHQCWRITASAS